MLLRTGEIVAVIEDIGLLNAVFIPRLPRVFALYRVT